MSKRPVLFVLAGVNSAQAAPGEAIPDPIPVAETRVGTLTWPTDPATLRRTPKWARPILESALSGPVTV